MLRFVTDVMDPLLELVLHDPVRPEISPEFRVGHNRFVVVLMDPAPSAVVCVSLHDFVPDTVEALNTQSHQPTVAIFYTLWSLAAGAGRRLLLATLPQLRQQYPNVTRFVTLSPKTPMARDFHLRNGAIVCRENLHTINYEYHTV